MVKIKVHIFGDIDNVESGLIEVEVVKKTATVKDILNELKDKGMPIDAKYYVVLVNGKNINVMNGPETRVDENTIINIITPAFGG